MGICEIFVLIFLSTSFSLCWDLEDYGILIFFSRCAWIFGCFLLGDFFFIDLLGLIIWRRRRSFLLFSPCKKGISFTKASIYTSLHCSNPIKTTKGNQNTYNQGHPKLGSAFGCSWNPPWSVLGSQPHFPGANWFPFHFPDFSGRMYLCSCM